MGRPTRSIFAILDHELAGDVAAPTDVDKVGRVVGNDLDGATIPKDRLLQKKSFAFAQMWVSPWIGER